MQCGLKTNVYPQIPWISMSVICDNDDGILLSIFGRYEFLTADAFTEVQYF